MNEMKKRLLLLIRDYAKSGREVDENYIVNLLKLLVEFKRLEGYVKIENTKFDSMLSSVAKYYFKEKMVRINPQNLDLEIGEYRKFYERYKKCLAYIPLVVTSEILLHETEHAGHIRVIGSDRDDIESSIIRTTYNLSEEDVGKIVMEERNAIYNHFNSFAPEERLADSCAYEIIADVLKELNRIELGDLGFLEYSYKFMALDSLLAPYDEAEAMFGQDENGCVSPTISYFNLMDVKDSNVLNSSSKNLPLKDRFLLGLPVSKDELLTLYKLEESVEKRISFYK